jgi:hypothetical protein
MNGQPLTEKEVIMRTENESQLICELREAKTDSGQVMLEGTVRLELPVPRQDGRLPAEVEQTVEQAGQEFKRWMYRHLMEKLDTELVLSLRLGKDQEGWICHGQRTMTFKTVFGTVQVSRRRIMHKADQSSEIPAAKAWNTPQQVTITQGLIDATCDAMLQESSRKSLRHVEERAGEAGLLGRVSVLNLVHEEGRQLREASQRRAAQIFEADPEAARCLLPHVAEPLVEGQCQTEESQDLWPALVGFPGAPTAEIVPEEEPRHVDADTVMVQADEVCVHAQASTGRKQVDVYNAMVRTAERTWCFSAENAQSLIFLVGGLLATLGVHHGQLRLLFVNDGARWIRDWFEGLRVPNKSLVLCWYHLAKRCFEGLATACGRKRAEGIAPEVLGHLWEGRVDEALAVLASHRQEMKVHLALNQLVQYIEKRRPYLPNYRERREAGLWIASNRVEKLNDWTVSQRCKHRGMDWTPEGVLALAILESTRRNGELDAWRRTRDLPRRDDHITPKQAA